MQKIRVGLIGCGTIGTGVAEVLLYRNQSLRERTGVDICLEAIADKDIETPRDIEIPKGLFTQNCESVLRNENIDVVIELIGGIHPAKEIILEALANGKHVVTANKALLATHGKEIFDKALEVGRSVSFEASVGGGIPIISSLRDGFAANEIKSVFGIVNGTSNYVLTQMTKENVEYDDGLAEAQRLGYAEKDPTLDVDGTDSAHKLAMLARMCFGVDVAFDQFHREGIVAIGSDDIQYAHELGYTLKLLAIGKREGDSVELRVHPTLLPHAHPLSSVSGVFNGICVEGDLVGETMFYGRGAGREPTSSAVMADTIDVALGRTQQAFGRMKLMAELGADLKVLDIESAKTRYYLHFTVIDRPGVLAKIAGILGRHQICIASVIQQEVGHDVVPLIMMTHLAEEGKLRMAVSEIDELDVVKQKTSFIRVEGHE